MFVKHLWKVSQLFSKFSNTEKSKFVFCRSFVTLVYHTISKRENVSVQVVPVSVWVSFGSPVSSQFPKNLSVCVHAPVKWTGFLSLIYSYLAPSVPEIGDR